jgi:hypothetical protein
MDGMRLDQARRVRSGAHVRMTTITHPRLDTELRNVWTRVRRDAQIGSDLVLTRPSNAHGAHDVVLRNTPRWLER